MIKPMCVSKFPEVSEVDDGGGLAEYKNFWYELLTLELLILIWGFFIKKKFWCGNIVSSWCGMKNHFLLFYLTLAFSI